MYVEFQPQPRDVAVDDAVSDPAEVDVMAQLQTSLGELTVEMRALKTQLAEMTDVFSKKMHVAPSAPWDSIDALAPASVTTAPSTMPSITTDNAYPDAVSTSAVAAPVSAVTETAATSQPSVSSSSTPAAAVTAPYPIPTMPTNMVSHAAAALSTNAPESAIHVAPTAVARPLIGTKASKEERTNELRLQLREETRRSNEKIAEKERQREAAQQQHDVTVSAVVVESSEVDSVVVSAPSAPIGLLGLLKSVITREVFGGEQEEEDEEVAEKKMRREDTPEYEQYIRSALEQKKQVEIAESITKRKKEMESYGKVSS